MSGAEDLPRLAPRPWADAGDEDPDEWPNGQLIKRRARLRRAIREAVAERRRLASPAPRYDDVFEAGLRWLEENG